MSITFDKKFDFKVVKKVALAPKIPQVIKREVFPHDIKRKLPAVPAPLTAFPKPVQYEIRGFANVRGKSKKFSFNDFLPVVSGVLLVTFLLQAVPYLQTAKVTSGIVLGSATTAYSELDAANKSLEEQDFTSAKLRFASAQENLAAAQSELDKFRALTALVPPARSADDVLTGAFFLAEAGKNLSTAMQLFDELSVNSAGISTANFAEKLQQNHLLLKNSLILLNYAEAKFDSAGSLPGDYAETLTHARSQISQLKTVLTDLVSLEDLFLSFFGTSPRTYLLVFQNYDEMRATGGFIGTYGVLKYDDGNIRQLKIESIYNLDGSLTKQFESPGPFQPHIMKWGIRDSNWFADFPTSAKKILSFFEMTSETADGIISLTPNVFVDILNLIGPVDMPAYNTTLTAENFQDVVQTQTSEIYDRELNQPKKFLHDFAPVMLDKLSNLGKEQWFALFQILKDNFLEKHVLMYSTDMATQKKIAELGFDGKILEAEYDYISVINSNHGGTKTDLDVKQMIDIKSEINPDGSVINTVKVTRGNTSELLNRNFMRLLVPLGSQLLEVHGFADQPQIAAQAPGMTTDPDLATWNQASYLGLGATRVESDKTAFTGWTETPGGSTSEVVIKYKLPFKVKIGLFNQSQPHSMVFQKQSGSLSTGLKGEVIILSKDKFDWSTGNTSRADKSVKFITDGDKDQYWGMLIR